MIINYRLSQKLPQQQARIFIISYQDETLYQHIKQHIKMELHCEVQESRILTHPEQWQELASMTQNFQLLPAAICYEFELSKNAFSPHVFEQYSPIQHDIFIFKTTEFKHAALSGIQTSKQHVWIQAYQPKPEELYQFLKTQLPTRQFAADIQTWFLKQANISFSSCKQFIEKASLAYPEQAKISLADFQQQFGIAIEETWYPLINHWLLGELPQTLHLFQHTAYKDSDLILLLWLLSRATQALIALKQQKRSTKLIFDECKIWPKQQELFIKALQKYSLMQLRRAIVHLQGIDDLLKSGKIPLAKIQIEHFLVISQLE